MEYSKRAVYYRKPPKKREGGREKGKLARYTGTRGALKK